jgi:hypothetical protein
MRKSRIKLNEIDISILGIIDKEPIEVFQHLESLSIKLPPWATIILLCQQPVKRNLDIMFFEDVQDFFIRYAKTVIRKSPEIDLFCYTNKGNGWTVFEPPTLIGPNLTTNLR